MKASACALALFAASSAHAAIIGVVTLPQGVTLRLHDTAGVCVSGALLAEYVTPGKPTIAGCWILRGPAVQVAFHDGEMGLIPWSDVRTPCQG